MQGIRVGVVGAGLMGAEIALVFALAGSRVIISDRCDEALEKARKRVATIVDKGIAAGRYDESAKLALDRLSYCTGCTDLAGSEVLTEAVFEDQAVKFDVLQALAEISNPDTLIATNTSTIPISTLAAALPPDRRGRFIGTHYFSPVSRMPLVEVIPGFETLPETVAETRSLMESIGKSAIDVKDVPGFAVNRMLHAMIIEAVRLVEEGVATPEDIDMAAKLGLGHAIGPFALMDAVTSTLCVQAQEIMQEAYGERFRPPALLKQRVRAGFGGGKGKPGWLAS
ncbi:3-hydroxyacyl-CoA dehydrogenase family protein [Altererythrobacter salegens]|uniref:3-hydroxyacyl-CoA dehydrogenase family protein n=2 Tax=Croceibacterium salegens TaxID=1737568 RepID=A0A6I4T0C1_9SPHN|nr:3-hydroxyacyl-CoA dehydrogenase family protein [Croceibacterium salegens]